MNVQGSRSGASGFTYLGVLFFIAIMGVELAAVSQVWHTAQRRDREEELLFAGDELRRAIGHYYDSTPDGAKRYPVSLQELLRDPRQPGVRRHLRKIYRDPMTGGVEWGLVKGPDGAILGVHSLSEEEPLKKGGFSRDDRMFQDRAKYSEWIFVHTPGHTK